MKIKKWTVPAVDPTVPCLEKKKVTVPVDQWMMIWCLRTLVGAAMQPMIASIGVCQAFLVCL